MVRRLNKYRKQAAGGESGFTLVEQIVTVAILGLVLTAAMAALATGGLSLNVATSRNEAMNLAQTQMECIKNQDFATGASAYSTCDLSTGLPAGYSLKFDVVKFATLPPSNKVQRIEVTVCRGVPVCLGGDGVLVLEDLKVNPQ